MRCQSFFGCLVVIVHVAAPALSQGTASSQAVNDSALRSAIDACVEHYMTLDNTPGLGLAVIRDHELFHERGFGVKDQIQGGDVNALTRFRIASVTKMFTAAAILRLVGDGLVQLDDPVIQFIPDLHFEGPWNAERITIRQLLTHTSSIFDFSGPVDAGSLDALVGWLGETRLSSPPGSFYNYAGPNYSLAGLLVERVTGIPFPEFLRARVWYPAGMDTTTLYPQVAVASGNVASGHRLGDNMIVLPQDFHDWVSAPAGHAFSSAHDLAVWAQLMMADGGSLLDSDLAEEMQEPQVWRNDWTGGFYGFGVVVEQLPTATLVYHDGLHVGYVAYLGWIAAEGLAVAMVANSNSMPIAAAARCIFQDAFDIPIPDVNEPSDPATWSRFKGTYNVVSMDGLEFPLVVDLVDHDLVVTYPDPDRPSNLYSAILTNRYLDTFRFVDVDGVGFDLTFINTRGRIGWVRNRRYVGLRLDPPRTVRRVRP